MFAGYKPEDSGLDIGDSAITETLDRWILSRLGETVAKATEAFAPYNGDTLAAQIL